jgi:hypothetical protein
MSTTSQPNAPRLTGLNHFVALTIVTALVIAWRAPEMLTKPQFWAEDGGVFFAQQYGRAWPQLFTPYWGYLHFIPRLIAWIASLFHITKEPLIYVSLGLSVDALCIAYVTRRSANLFASLVVWLSFTLAPSDGLYYGYIQNIQWFSQFVLIAMCLFPKILVAAETTPKRILVYFTLIACALTGPFSALVAALAGFAFVATLSARTRFPPKRLWLAFSEYWSRLPKDRIVIVSICALIQLITAARSPTGDLLSLPSSSTIMQVIGVWPQEHFFGLAFIPSAAFLLLVLAGIVALMKSHAVTSDQKVVCFLMLAMAVCELALGTLKSGAIGPGMMGGDRYFYLGKTAAWWVIVLLAAPYFVKSAQATLIVAGAMLWIAFMNIDYMRRAPLPDLDWHRQAKQIQAGEKTLLQINPPWWGNAHIVISPPRKNGS